VKDLCPNEPETFNKFRDEDGCPDRGNVVVEDNNIVILKKIQFKTGSAEILPESNEILDAVSGTIKDHPEFQLVEVAGHADERSPDAYNLQLTQLRVNAVVAALVARGDPGQQAPEQGLRRVLPRGSRAQRGRLGEEPARRVQDREDGRRPHGRRARLQKRAREGREARPGALKPRPPVSGPRGFRRLWKASIDVWPASPDAIAEANGRIRRAHEGERRGARRERQVHGDRSTPFGPRTIGSAQPMSGFGAMPASVGAGGDAGVGWTMRGRASRRTARRASSPPRT
jgi:hypothetical protein